MELKITKEKVLEAASKCSQAKETLKTLFPECFKETEDIRPFEVTVSTASNDFIFIARGLAPNGYRGRCFGLSTNYDREITENQGIKMLIPTLRQ